MVICKTEDSDLETHSELTNWLGTITIINRAAVLSDGYECRKVIVAQRIIYHSHWFKNQNTWCTSAGTFGKS